MSARSWWAKSPNSKSQTPNKPQTPNCEKHLAPGAGFGLAAGLMYAAADVGTKSAWYGGWFLLLIIPVWACHGLAFTLIQLSFQRGLLRRRDF